MEIFCIALVVLVWLRGIDSQWKWADCVFLGISLGLCALSYYYAYGAIVASIFVYFLSTYLLRAKDGKGEATAYLLKPLVVFFVAFLIAGWFFIRNAILYNGDFFGMATSSLTSEKYAQDYLKPSNRITPQSEGMSVLDMLVGTHNGLNWVSSTSRSFVGMFGLMNIVLGNTTYNAYFILMGIGLLASVFCFVSCFCRISAQKRTLVIGLILLIAIPCALSICYSWASDYQPQGRYLFAALIPIMIAMTSGCIWIANLLAPIRAKTNERNMNSSSSVRGVVALAIPYLFMVAWALLFVWVFVSRILVCCTGVVL